MAVTGRKAWAAALLLACTLGGALPIRADESTDIRDVIGGVANALSSGDPALAISAFSKDYPEYETLSTYFDALTGAYSVVNEVNFTDEDDSAASATVTVHWAMTISTRQTAFTDNRNADITIKLVLLKKHWRIVGFSPIAMFNPK